MRAFLLFLFAINFIISNAQINYSIGLNGSNQYVSIGAPLSNNSSYTKEAWVNVGSVGGSQNIISSNAAPFWLNSGILSAGHGGSYSQVTDGTAFPSGQWVHIAVTYDAGTTTMKLYKNGALISSNAAVASNYASENTYIGSHSGGSSLINGSIDEIRIWSVALTQAQLKQNMYKGPVIGASGLVAYYKCDDGAGSVLTNNAGGSNGTLFNSPTWSTSPIIETGNGISFDGSDDYITIPHVVSSDFTVEYWMKTVSTGAGGSGSQWYGGSGIVDAEVGGGTYDWGTSLIGNKLAFGIGQPDLTIESSSSVNTGSWVHVAASWKQSTGEMKLYINGVQEATNTGSTNLRTAPPRITFGRLQTNINSFAGSIDEVRIWNDVRSLAQIQANMDNELSPSTETTLLAYYTFNQGVTNGTNTGLITLADMKGNNNGTLNGFTLSGSTSNYTAQNGALFVLPLQWLSFTVQKQADKSFLKWSTAQEQNTKDFIIQHSSNAATWNNIAVITAAGNSNTRSDYSYIHTTPVKGINYYRILQTDLDGKNSYSSVRTISFKNDAVSFSILNNPIANTTLLVKLSNPTSLSLYSSDGRLLWKKQVNAGIETIDMSGHAKGVYLLKSNNESKKILLQ